MNSKTVTFLLLAIAGIGLAQHYHQHQHRFQQDGLRHRHHYRPINGEENYDGNIRQPIFHHHRHRAPMTEDVAKPIYYPDIPPQPEDIHEPEIIGEPDEDDFMTADLPPPEDIVQPPAEDDFEILPQPVEEEEDHEAPANSEKEENPRTFMPPPPFSRGFGTLHRAFFAHQQQQQQQQQQRHRRRENNNMFIGPPHYHYRQGMRQQRFQQRGGGRGAFEMGYGSIDQDTENFLRGIDGDFFADRNLGDILDNSRFFMHKMDVSCSRFGEAHSHVQMAHFARVLNKLGRMYGLFGVDGLDMHFYEASIALDFIISHHAQNERIFQTVESSLKECAEHWRNHEMENAGHKVREIVQLLTENDELHLYSHAVNDFMSGIYTSLKNSAEIPAVVLSEDAVRNEAIFFNVGMAWRLLSNAVNEDVLHEMHHIAKNGNVVGKSYLFRNSLAIEKELFHSLSAVSEAFAKIGFAEVAEKTQKLSNVMRQRAHPYEGRILIDKDSDSDVTEMFMRAAVLWSHGNFAECGQEVGKMLKMFDH